MTTLLLIHAASTWAMTGLIWFVQLVHYPLFPFAARGNFVGFAADHQQRTSWVVAPLMLVEIGTATGLVYLSPSSALVWLGLVLLASIWLSTALIQVPAHRRLSVGFDARTVDRLVASNWWRTFAWTARALIVSLMLGGQITLG